MTQISKEEILRQFEEEFWIEELSTIKFLTDMEDIKSFLSKVYDDAFELGCDVPRTLDSKLKNEWVSLGYERAYKEFEKLGSIFLNEMIIYKKDKDCPHCGVNSRLMGGIPCLTYILNKLKEDRIPPDGAFKEKKIIE